MGVKLGRSHWGRNVGWGFSRIRCWGGYLGPRETRRQGSGEDYITRNFMLWSPHQIFSGYPNKNTEIGSACSTYGGEKRCTQGLVGKLEGRRPLGRPRCRSEDNIKMEIRKVEWGHRLDWSGSGYGHKGDCGKCGNEPSGSIKFGEFLD